MGRPKKPRSSNEELEKKKADLEIAREKTRREAAKKRKRKKDWESPYFRQQFTAKIEQTILQYGITTTMTASEMESHIFERVKNKANYLNCISCLLKHLAKQSPARDSIEIGDVKHQAKHEEEVDEDEEAFADGILEEDLEEEDNAISLPERAKPRIIHNDRGKSVIWKFFGFEMGSQLKGKSEWKTVVCKICFKTYQITDTHYKLKVHLLSKHKSTLPSDFFPSFKLEFETKQIINKKEQKLRQQIHHQQWVNNPESKVKDKKSTPQLKELVQSHAKKKKETHDKQLLMQQQRKEQTKRTELYEYSSDEEAFSDGILEEVSEEEDNAISLPKGANPRIIPNDRGRALIWRFFGFKAIGNSGDYNKHIVVCIICYREYRIITHDTNAIKCHMLIEHNERLPPNSFPLVSKQLMSSGRIRPKEDMSKCETNINMLMRKRIKLSSKKITAFSVFMDVIFEGFYLKNHQITMPTNMNEHIKSRWERLTSEDRLPFEQVMEKYNSKISNEMCEVDKEIIALQIGERISNGFVPVWPSLLPQNNPVFDPIFWSTIISNSDKYGYTTNFDWLNNTVQVEEESKQKWPSLSVEIQEKCIQQAINMFSKFSTSEEGLVGSVEESENLSAAKKSLLQKVICKELVENNHDLEVQRKDRNSPIYSVKTFEALNICPKLLKGLHAMGFDAPSKIQKTALPTLLVDPPQNVIALSQSGTGKTVAFVLVMLSRTDVSKNYPHVVCLSPTFELAFQTGELLKKMAIFCPLIKIRYAVRGEEIPRGTQLNDHILIGTPGKLLDWGTKLRCFDLTKIEVFVLDEADIMIATQGHQDQSIRIHKLLLNSCQMMLFSATYDEHVMKFAEMVIRNPVVLKLQREQKSLDNIKQRYVVCKSKMDKYRYVSNVYGVPNLGQAVIFCHTRQTASWLAETMSQEGAAVALLSGELESEQINTIINRFRDAKVKVLVTTNMMAQCIDVEQVTMVINFDLPVDQNGMADCETYLQCIGRSRNFGKRGVAINLIDGYLSMLVLKFIEAHFKQPIVMLDAKQVVELEKLNKDD